MNKHIAVDTKVLRGRLLPEPAKTHPLPTFFGLTFLLFWSFWIPMIVIGRELPFLRIGGTFGPLEAALIVTGVRDGSTGVGRLLKRFLIWRVNVLRYLFVLFSIAMVVFTALGIYFASGGHQLMFNDPRQAYLVVPVFLYVLMFSVLGEETGRRGFAFPRLQKWAGPLRTSLIREIPITTFRRYFSSSRMSLWRWF